MRPAISARLAALVLALVSPAATHAALMAFNPTGSTFTNGVGNDGLYFTPITPISITKLGYYNGGFLQSHPVALYKVSTRELITSINITGSSPLSGNFRFEDITPIELTTGTQYAVVGFHPQSAYGETAILASSLNTNPAITFGGYRYNYDSQLSFPTISYPTPILGPNFQFVATPPGSNANASGIPEPTSLALLTPPALLLLRPRRTT